MITTSASAQAKPSFSLERYVPTRLGEDSFWVDAPSESTLKHKLSLGITGGYANNPLVVTGALAGNANAQFALVEHEAIAHLQAGISFGQRFVVSLDIPLIFIHQRDRAFGIHPGSQFSLQDVRVSGLLSVFRDLGIRRNALFFSLDAFVPSGGRALSSDRLPRLLPKAILTSKLANQLSLSATVGALLQQQTAIGALPPAPGNYVGSELQGGLRLRLMNQDKSWSVGPELVASTSLVGGGFFNRKASSVEILGGVHWMPHPSWHFGVAVGGGLLAPPGTPTFRGILRVSYASINSARPSTTSGFPPIDLGMQASTEQEQKPAILPVQPPELTQASEVPEAPRPASGPLEPISSAPVIEVKQDGGSKDIHVLGDTLFVPPLIFGAHRANLLRQCAPTMMSLISFLKAHPEVKRLVIENHTDNVGRKRANKRLSLLRARKIRTLLVRHGVSRSRLIIRGAGQASPLMPNDTDEHRSMNNRTIFRIED